VGLTLLVDTVKRQSLQTASQRTAGGVSCPARPPARNYLRAQLSNRAHERSAADAKPLKQLPGRQLVPGSQRSQQVFGSCHETIFESDEIEVFARENCSIRHCIVKRLMKQ
jgi:hypothetical protein